MNLKPKPEDLIRRSAEPGMVFPVLVRPSISFEVYDAAFIERVPHDPDKFIDWKELGTTPVDVCKTWTKLIDGPPAREMNFILISSNLNGGFFIPAERMIFVSMNWWFVTENLLVNTFLELNGLRND